jgi:hypothetical protein
LDQHGLLKLISPALTGSKLNSAGLTRLEKIAHSVLPSGYAGGWLAFLTVLLDKLSATERAAVIKGLGIAPDEAAALKKLPAQAKKLEAALKSPSIHRPSQVWLALEGAAADEVLTVLYQSAARVVQDRIRAFYQKYLPMAQEITAEQVAATGAKPGTPKFEKARIATISSYLNARPKKVELPEPEPEPPPMAMVGGRGRK